MIATNAYVKTPAGWKMILHHASQAAEGRAGGGGGAVGAAALSVWCTRALRGRTCIQTGTLRRAAYRTGQTRGLGR
ncbi:MAG: hypothetical protein MZW92_35490 [Comamonadaceae bacterium]|nr:hypothetical protein [Comamonadaceae bacterium]